MDRDDSVPQTPWERMNAQRLSQRQEKRNAKLPGGRKQVNSGRHWFSRRDNRLGGFLVETRRTDSGRYCITEKEWGEIVKDAFSTPPGQLPGMQIDLGKHQLFVMRLEDHLYREARLGTGENS
jgi:hypothetical protein